MQKSTPFSSTKVTELYSICGDIHYRVKIEGDKFSFFCATGFVGSRTGIERALQFIRRIAGIITAPNNQLKEAKKIADLLGYTISQSGSQAWLIKDKHGVICRREKVSGILHKLEEWQPEPQKALNV